MHSHSSKHDFVSKDKKSMVFFYETYIGRIILKILVRPFFTNLSEHVLNSKFSCLMIDSFVRKNHIDMSQFECRKFTSFNDFFTRRIKDGMRKIDLKEESAISPSDAKLSAYKIDKNSCFYIKNSWYSLSDLLKSNTLAEKYIGGDLLVYRLEATDYHRYCYIDNGYQKRNYYIKGEFHSVQPIALRNYPVFKHNSRSFTILHTENFGDVIQMEVGALFVGKINNFYEKASFKKGTEKGMFEFGGSTIIVIYPKDRVTVFDRIFKNTEKGIETVVKMGECIGVKKYR